MKIKKGDMVQMLVGKDRGRRGRVLVVRPRDMKVLVEGLNLVRRHRRPRKAGQKGQIVSLPRSVPISSVALVCPSCGKAVRVGFQKSEASKLRVCKRCKNTFS